MVAATNFLKRSTPALFCYGLAGSSVILNVFIFSRMYGLVLLVSLLLVMAGEIYLQTYSRKEYLRCIGLFVIGMFGDYNFVLLGPYLCLLPFCKKRYHQKIAILLLVTMALVWLVLTAWGSKADPNPLWQFTFRSFSSLMQLGFSVGHTLMNYYYWGLIGLGFLAITICFAWNTWSSESSATSDEYLLQDLYFVCGLCSLAYYLLSVHAVQ